VRCKTRINEKGERKKETGAGKGDNLDDIFAQEGRKKKRK
jgi:hypothetical protein